MRLSYYERSPERVNPEFVGLASKYSDHKRKRLNFERRKRELDSDVQYTSKLDGSLEKALENKINELEKLQQARQRHMDHIKYKEQLEQRRQAELARLREKNTQDRNSTKANIEQARDSIRQRNRLNKQELELDLSRLSLRLEQFVENRLQDTHNRHQLILEQRRLAKERVDSFHKERNRESLNTYLSKIKKERSLKKEHNRRIKDHERNLEDLSKTVEVKKQYLQELQSEIYKYRTDIRSVILPGARRHSQASKTLSQSRFLPNEYSAIEHTDPREDPKPE